MHGPKLPNFRKPSNRSRQPFPWLFSPHAHSDERIQYHPIDLRALAQQPLARGKCAFRRDADVVEARPPKGRISFSKAEKPLEFARAAAASGTGEINAQCFGRVGRGSRMAGGLL